MENKIYLTFDMDWANDTVLEYFYNLLKIQDIPATIFVTHDTKWLDMFRKDPQIELGIHPNFNKLLLGGETKNYQEIIDDLLELVPEAVSYRSHALTVSSLIISYCVKRGIRYDLNQYVFPENGMKLKEYLRNGIQVLPFIFEDDIWLWDKRKESVEYYLGNEFDAPRIFNFHPIHLYLNCESLERYEKAKIYYHDPQKLGDYRNKNSSDGIENLFVELVNKARERGMKFGLISKN